MNKLNTISAVRANHDEWLERYLATPQAPASAAVPAPRRRNSPKVTILKRGRV